MSEIPIRVPVRLPHEEQRETTVDVHTEIEMRMGARLRGFSRAGLVLVILGAVATTLSLLLFAFAFPDYVFAIKVEAAVARLVTKALVLGFGLGATLVLFGTTLFFYGRSVVGRAVGTTDARAAPVEGGSA